MDLHIETDGDSSSDDLLDRELRIHAALQRRLGERRIDIVVHRRGAPPRSIDTHPARSRLEAAPQASRPTQAGRPPGGRRGLRGRLADSVLIRRRWP
jgi:hypothetical protein